MRTFLKFLAILFLAMSLLPVHGDAQRRHHRRAVKADVSEKKITKKAIPPEVLKAFEEKYPTAVITGQIRQVRERIPFYEIQSTDSAITRDVLFQEDGTIVEIGESIDESDLPQAVRDGLKDKYPSASVEAVDRVSRGPHVEYEITLTIGKKKVDVVANTAGKVFQVR